MGSSHLLASILCFLAYGCVTWHAQALPVRAVLETAPRGVRLNTAREGVVVLDKPVVRNDSVFGKAMDGKHRGFALSEVTSVQTAGGSTAIPKLTVLAIALVVGYKVLEKVITPDL